MEMVKYRSIWLLVFCYAVVIIYVMHNYIQLNTLPFLLGILAFPFTVQKGVFPTFTYRYAIVAILCLLLCYFIPVKTLLYFSTGFAVLFLLETFYGKAGLLSLVLLILVAPVFQYAANVFSFPIRLQLTEWAGVLFKLGLDGVTTKGNMIYYRGNEFSVDPACMGLNMLVASLVLGVIFIGFYQRRPGMALHWYWVLLCLGVVMILNIFSNLVRIVLLVLFHLMPGNWLHDAAGIVCLVVYVLLPISFIARFMVKTFGALQEEPLKVMGEKNEMRGMGVQDVITVKGIKGGANGLMVMHGILPLLLLLLSLRVASIDTFSNYQLNTKKVSEYKASQFAPGIIKLESNRALIYVKYIRGFYDSDHNPTICWTGNGYELRQVKSCKIYGHELYTAMLVHGTEKLYTAWWYGNHNKTITNQFEWRWDMARNAKKYAVVNVTAATEQDLRSELIHVLQTGTLASLFSDNHSNKK